MITDIDFVGFEDEFQKIRGSLVDGPEELAVVSLVGMPGNGKTTLAQKLYQDPLVRLHFDIRAWCTVSHLYQKRDVRHTILCQVDELFSEKVVVDEDGMAERIAQNLKRRRYLIIIDDIWDIKPWNDLRRYLPNDNNRSRILITTRNQDVAKQTSLVPSNVHSLRVFTEAESYELLERKAGLKDDNQSEDLLQVGHQISLRCKGLPLAIAIVGGHLAKVEKNVKEWKKVLAGLSSRILNDKHRPYRVMLEWSYNRLPNHLKPCFLYAGVLAANKIIRVWKLKVLWIAEGLVSDDKSESLEKKAEDYLMDLINRSLIIPTRECATGGVKEFRMHDLLKDFCLQLSAEQNFMHQITNASLPESCESKDLAHADETDNSRNLSIWTRKYSFQIWKPFGPDGRYLRSLLMSPFGNIDKNNLHAAISSMNLQHLQVLDMNDELRIGDILGRMKLRSHLRYLAVRSSLPSFNLIKTSVFSFTSLETLILDGFGPDDVVYVPDSLWDMEKLRNVHVRGECVRFEVKSSRLMTSFPKNIETLATPFFPSPLDAVILRRMPMLRKLSFKYGNSWDDSRNLDRNSNLSFLIQLVSLKISGPYYGFRLTPKFEFPSNLRKLTLRQCKIYWDEISSLGRKLPSLEVLKIEYTYEGRTWTVKAGDFPNLRYLKIRINYEITEWLATEESFPKLEQLHLDCLPRLEEIPCSFEDAVCLQVITASYCRRSLNDSATRIGKVQKEELLNEELVVAVRRPIYNLPHRMVGNDKPFSEDVRRPIYDLPHYKPFSEGVRHPDTTTSEVENARITRNRRKPSHLADYKM